MGKNGEDDTSNVGEDDTSNVGDDEGEGEGKKLEIEELVEVAEDEEGKPIWFVKWKGHDESKNTWEPREYLDEDSREGHLFAPSCQFLACLTFYFCSHTSKYRKLIPCIHGF